MTLSPRLLPALILAAAFAASGPVLAAEPEAVATAAAAGAPPSVAEQIDNYLKTSPAAALPKDGASGVISGSEEPRKVHGVADVSVGTGGYRSAYVRSDFPVGKTGTVSIAVEDTQFGNRFGGRYGGQFAPGSRQSFALGLRFDGALDPSDCRRRQAGDDGPDGRFDPRLDGQRLQSCRSADALRSPQ
ncbi:MAG: hypothetical protein JWR47_1933 [Phenylobacterium sp.]|jgi:hypothetical protein|uniref:hypothetical protein n=1 Tax=Phenylobacterium sp. TaxID=1871053 RepID=UPI00261BFFB9|nr:hypothetical protein [Phenylobacterium sp.]MDB5427361.1 hypothetical protein [Phenylobacterium sp.]MDB5435676.1 hypothetical protein [Phenylobacterium sp.]MDB5463911.1 hypothetical protein [Phenylobacterium sp.]MDB5497143.1 hypothetical protein [Phenylobacterium sp.]